MGSFLNSHLQHDFFFWIVSVHPIPFHSAGGATCLQVTLEVSALCWSGCQCRAGGRRDGFGSVWFSLFWAMSLMQGEPSSKPIGCVRSSWSWPTATQRGGNRWEDVWQVVPSFFVFRTGETEIHLESGLAFSSFYPSR